VAHQVAGNHYNMSQEILFLIFMTAELCAIMGLYTFVIIPRMAHAASIKTNDVFEQRMMDKTWDIPAMLEDYTKHLLVHVDALFFGFTDDDDKKHKGKIQEIIPAVITGAFGAGMKEVRKDNPAMEIMDEAMEDLPWYAKALLLKATGGNPEGLLGALQGASKGLERVQEVSFSPKFGLK